MSEILGQIQKDMQERFDNEICKIFRVSEENQTTSEDIISDINGMAVKMTTLIMCSPNNKKLLKERKDKLPPMTKIFKNPLLGDDDLYLITDNETKKSMLKCMEILEKKKHTPED